MIEIKHLTKSYGKFKANDDISLQVPNQCIMLLVGPNGAGKSTLLKSIVGLLKYQGEILIDDFSNKSLEGRKRVAYVPEIPALYPLLTVEEHLELTARLYKVKDFKEKINDLLSRFDLIEHRKKLGGELSKGMQQKTSICCALIHNPDIYIFDEPLIGLDPKAIREVKNLFSELKAAGKSLLISTHILDTVDELWDEVMIMVAGKIVAAEKREDLVKRDLNLEKLFFDVTEKIIDAKTLEGASL